MNPGSVEENPNFKFIETKKYHIDGHIEDESALNLLAVSNEYQLAFIGVHNGLKVASLTALFNYDYAKNIINVIEKFDNWVAEFNQLNIEPKILSIGGRGYGLTLAICGTNQNRSVIQFFSIEEILQYRHGAKAFAQIDNVGGSSISDIAWHPDHIDNLLVAVTNAGDLVSIQVDSGSRRAVMLQKLSGVSATCVSWSPKGKQLVVGFHDGSFKQFKHEKGSQITEAKNMPCHPDLSGCSMFKIEWVLTSIFTAVYSNSSNDRHFVLISLAPKSSEAAYVDFGGLSMDSMSIESNSPAPTQIVSFNNMLILSSLRSAEVAVVGCEDANNAAQLEKWFQWMLEDTARLELPMTKAGDERFPRGIALSYGLKRTITISENEKYSDTPILFVLSSDGLLCPYHMAHKNGFPPPVKPKKIALPLSSATGAAQPSQAPQYAPSQVTSSAPSLTPHSTPSAPQQPSPQTTGRPRVSQVQPQQQATSAASSAPSISTQAAEPSKHSSRQKDAQAKAEADDAFFKATVEEINSFHKELCTSREKFAAILNLNVGSQDERKELISNIPSYETYLQELLKSLKGDSLILEELTRSLLESFTIGEEVKSRLERNQDPNYLSLLRKKSLDPVLARKYNDIKSITRYIDSQLHELEVKVEQEWQEYQESRRKEKKKFGAPKSNAKSQQIDLIFKNLTANKRILSSLNERISELETFTNKSSDLSDMNSELRRIENSFRETTLNNKDEVDNFDELARRGLTEERNQELLDFFEDRLSIPVPVRRDAFSDYIPSRFLSFMKKLEKDIGTSTSKDKASKPPTVHKPELSSAKPTFISTDAQAPSKDQTFGEPSLSLLTSQTSTPNTSRVISQPTAQATSALASLSSKLTSLESKQNLGGDPGKISTPSMSSVAAPSSNQQSSASFSFNLGTTPSFAPSSTAPAKPSLATTFMQTSTPKPLDSVPSFGKSDQDLPSSSIGTSSKSSSTFSFTTAIASLAPTTTSGPSTSTTSASKSESKPLFGQGFAQDFSFGGLKEKSDQEKSEGDSTFNLQLSTSKSEERNQIDICSGNKTTFDSIFSTPTSSEDTSSSIVVIPTSKDGSPARTLATFPPHPPPADSNSSTLETKPLSLTADKAEKPVSPFGSTFSLPASKPPQIESRVASSQAQPSAESRPSPSVTSVSKTTEPPVSQAPVEKEQSSTSQESQISLGGLGLGSSAPTATAKSPFSFTPSTPATSAQAPASSSAPTSASSFSFLGSLSSSQPQQTSSFSSPGQNVSSGGFSSAAAPGVAQGGFGAFSSQPKSSFGGSPVFGGTPAFGAPPAFGSSSPGGFGAPPAFGSGPSFGATPVFGSSISPSFGVSSTSSENAPFAAFAQEDVPTFGSLATQNPPSFGTVAQQPSSFASGGGFGGFGNQPSFGQPQPSFGQPQPSFGQAQPSFGSPSFSQPQPPVSSPSFLQYR